MLGINKWFKIYDEQLLACKFPEIILTDLCLYSLQRGKDVRRAANTEMSHLNTGDMEYVFPGIFLVPQRIPLNRKIIEVHDLLKHLWFGGLEAG